MTTSPSSPMPLGRLNHVGIATPSIDQSLRLYRDLLGATIIRAPFDLPSQQVRVCFIDLPNSQIELVEPLGESGPVHRFLARHPLGGQHHVCFEVSDILAARDHLVAHGAEVLNRGEPRIGAHGVPMIFVQPKHMGGVLIELMAELPVSH